jgi:hypothetical protein
MQESMPNPAQPTARLFANGSSPGRPIARRVPHICPNLADVGRAEGPSRFSRTAFPTVAIARASIFESHALTTSTFDPNTYPPPVPEAHRTHLKTQ